MESLASQQSRHEEGTDVRRFLARRGAILIKETRDIGRVPGLYRDSLLISTAVLAFVKGQHKDMSYGVHIQRQDAEEVTESSVYLDFDELTELIDGFDFIRTSAKNMVGQERDYTEVTYSTKDNARIGFFLQSGKLQCFVSLESHRDTSFFDDTEFQRLKLLLLKSRDHLVARGASVA